mmetsp:Transcript_19564/g.48725  ORF Transcript_19564/g.48725 Transcript_19564/m.48725 type:complete len:261 (+) Transcript_19564:104-886(+)|eukprot:CAMPEP_0116079538 /NCGR_PEP_ID=MMETSP0327-20121206/1195_1 /TAXON_ID=44447 /ORGANISM="Pseudo-nitzschia delicatissima, Strain B596" /LENGTH=260 /DNA_ID=CAMNT_0003570169 /DNA_START=18 /DNA_END=800 /DNA_ORIENTATION=-
MNFSRGSNPSSIDGPQTTTSLNDRLDTSYVDLGSETDSYGARYTKTVTGFVGEFVTPRQLLVIIRIMKAVTFVFLILTLAANIMYITFLEVLASSEVRDIVGGRRDMIIRVYGLFLSAVAIAIEVDVAWVVKGLNGFKGFLARSFLIFFVSAITGANPLYIEERNNLVNQNAYNNYDDNYDDDAAYAANYSEIPEIPMSVVNFQRVTSFFLGVCAIAYFISGVLCFDRFTSKAYLSSNDPLVSTAIPQPSMVDKLQSSLS